MVARTGVVVAFLTVALAACGDPALTEPPPDDRGAARGTPGDAGSDAPAPEPDRTGAKPAAVLAPACEDLRAERYAAYAPAEPSPDPGAIPTPAYATMDLGAVVTLAREVAGDDFAGHWIEPPGTGDVTVAFVGDVDAYRAALHERFGDGIRVVEAERSLAEIEALQREIDEEMGRQWAALADDPGADRHRPAPGTIVSSGQMTDLGRVSVGVVGGDDRPLAELTARYGAERICLEVHELPPPMDHDGPVRPLAKVTGWRDGFHTDAYALAEIAYDRETAARAWRENVPAGLPVLAPEGDPVEDGVYGALDEVDFSTHALVVWSAGESGSCPGWLADIDAGGGEAVVELGTAGAGICTSDYQPYRMVLAVGRDRLPAPETVPLEARSGRFVTAVVDAYR